MRARCPHCDAPLAPTAERCERCGSVALRAAGPEAAVTLARPPAPFASGDQVAGRYCIVENFGAGPLGTTYSARDPEGHALALKVMAPQLFADPTERQRFRENVAQFVGRSIEKVSAPLDVGEDPSGALYVVSRWAQGASLRRILRAYRAADRRLERDQVLGILQGAAAALRALHTVSSHGALYPENVHITAEGVMLTDPGLAASLVPARFAAQLEHFPEVLPYLAPEVRGGRRSNAGADLHALGALASELLFGDPGRTASGQFVASDLGEEVAEALRALVGVQPARRAGALPQLLERLARVAGEPSLPPYAPLPRPAALTDARTRRVPTVPRRVPTAVGPKTSTRHPAAPRARSVAPRAVEPSRTKAVDRDDLTPTVPLDDLTATVPLEDV